MFASALIAVPAPADTTVPRVDYVIHISVDGMGSAYLQALLAAGQAPNFQRLQDEGAWTLNARNDTDSTVTLPNHTSMITGRPVAGELGHNYTDNSTPLAGVTLHTNKGSYVASVYDVAHDNGLRTAMYSSKTKFTLFENSYNAANGAPDVTGVDNGTNKIDDYKAADYPAQNDAFIAMMSTTPANYAFLHYDVPDNIGHDYGWGSTTYNNALKEIDGYLGGVLNLVNTSSTLQGHTAIILSADHGGDGGGHSTVTAPLHYTIPFFVWGPGVSGNSNLYGINSTRLDPGSGRPLYTGPVQPIRNSDGANLALQMLGLGPVPGSSVNAAQDLVVLGDAPTKRVIAYTAFNEPVEGVGTWVPGVGSTELGFTSQSTIQGTTDPTVSLAATYDSTSSPLRLRMRNVLGQTTFDAVNLEGFYDISASIDILIKSTTYESDDYFRAWLTNGVDTLTLVDLQGTELNGILQDKFLRYSMDIPSSWTTATLRVASSTNSSSGAEAVDFDNIFFEGMSVPLPSALGSGLVGLCLLVVRRRSRSARA